MTFEQLPSGASDVGLHGQRHGGSSGMHLLEEPESGNDRLGHCASIDGGLPLQQERLAGRISRQELNLDIIEQF
jgi:hypothetical protein